MAFRLLALDLSTNVGHALMERGRPPVLGTWPLPKVPLGDNARRYAALWQWLHDMRALHQFDGIAWERPVVPVRRDGTTDALDELELLISLAGICRLFAGIHGLAHTHISWQDVKIALTGSKHAKKPDMIAAAMKIGWKPATDHEADAGAVGICAMAILNPKRAAA